MAEKAYILGGAGIKYTKKFNSSIKDFINNYNQLIENDLPEAMEEYFGGWQNLINIIESSKDNKEKSKALWEISREITY